MLENRVIPSSRVVPSVFLRTDRSVLSIWVWSEASFYSWGPCNFSTMSSSRKRTTKKFKMRFSGGSWTTKAISSRVLRMSQSWVSTIMYLISQPWLIDSAHACKSRMNYQKISRLCSMRNYTSSTRIWSRRRWICIRRSTWSTNRWRWSLRILKRPCLHCRQQFLHHLWKNCRHRVSSSLTWMISSQVKR